MSEGGARMQLFRTKRVHGLALQNMRAQVDYLAEPADWFVSRSQVDGVDRFQWIDTQSGSSRRIADVSKLREAFFSVKTPDQAMAFLQASGPFRERAIEVTWPAFQLWQAYFKKQRILAKGWGMPPEYRKPDDQEVERIIRTPTLEVATLLDTKAPQVALLARCESVVESIAASIWLEKLARVRIVTCDYCADPFEPATVRARFCKHACSHAFGQRRRAQASRDALERVKKLEGETDGKA